MLKLVKFTKSLKVSGRGDMIRTRDPLLPKKQHPCYHTEIIGQAISIGIGTPGKRVVNLETRLEQFNGLGSTSLVPAKGNYILDIVV